MSDPTKASPAAEIRELTLHDNISQAIADGGSFLFRARLGWRSELRQELRALAYEQSKRLSITTPWPDLVGPDESVDDWFYVLVMA